MRQAMIQAHKYNQEFKPGLLSDTTCKKYRNTQKRIENFKKLASDNKKKD